MTIAQQIKWDFKTNGNLEIRNKDWQLIYLELSNAFWAKWEHDSKGKEIYYEDSKGEIIDNRTPEVIEHNGHKYKLIK